MKITRSLIALALSLPLWAQAQAMNYEEARLRVLTRSDRLGAAQAATRSKELRRQALENLGGPMLSLMDTAYAYNANLGVSLDPLKQGVGQFVGGLPPLLQGILSLLPLPQIPSTLTFNNHGTGNVGLVNAIWPLYLGGAPDAARGLVDAQVHEAQADQSQATEEVETLLVQRYFGAQLARRGAQLRDAALATIREHDAAAARMLEAGLISRVERLQARAALAEAERNALKAHDDAELAGAALARTVQTEGPVEPQTPLFVLSQPLEPLAHFLDLAMQHHPGLSKVAAKKAQAEQSRDAEEAAWKPQAFAYGVRQLSTGSADWIAGVGVNWTLYDSLDRKALTAASEQLIEQARLSDQQARSDIALLVEKNWRSVEQARRQFVATAPGVELAQALLKLREAGLREGTSTTLDLIDAETNLVKTRTERAQIANDYVQALAQLLQSCGQSEAFGSYLTRADMKLEEPTP